MNMARKFAATIMAGLFFLAQPPSATATEAFFGRGGAPALPTLSRAVPIKADYRGAPVSEMILARYERFAEEANRTSLQEALSSLRELSINPREALTAEEVSDLHPDAVMKIQVAAQRLGMILTIPEASDHPAISSISKDLGEDSAGVLRRAAEQIRERKRKEPEVMAALLNLMEVLGHNPEMDPRLAAAFAQFYSGDAADRGPVNAGAPDPALAHLAREAGGDRSRSREAPAKPAAPAGIASVPKGIAEAGIRNPSAPVSPSADAKARLPKGREIPKAAAERLIEALSGRPAQKSPWLRIILEETAFGLLPALASAALGWGPAGLILSQGVSRAAQMAFSRAKPRLTQMALILFVTAVAGPLLPLWGLWGSFVLLGMASNHLQALRAFRGPMLKLLGLSLLSVYLYAVADWALSQGISVQFPPAHVQAATTRLVSPVPFNAATYNTGLLSMPIKGDLVPQVERRAAELEKALPEWAARENLDVLMLQEVWEEGDAQRLAEAFKRRGYTVIRPRQRVPLYLGSGLLLAVKGNHAIRRVSFEAFEEKSGLQNISNQGILACEIVPEGSPAPLIIIGTHMQPMQIDPQGLPASGSEAQTHVRQIHQLKRVVERRTMKGRWPALIMGDFNAGPGYVEGHYRELSRGWKDAFRELHTDRAITWDLGNPFAQAVGECYPDAPSCSVDHIFASDGRAGAWTSVQAGVDLNKAPLSDHYAVRARLMLAADPKARD